MERVGHFRYFGDVLEAGGGAERAAVTRTAAAWRRSWRELAGLMSNKHIPLKGCGNVYEACIRSVIHYGCET